MRAFIAIELPRELKQKLVEFVSLLQKSGVIDAKFVRPEQLHLTLKFLGEVHEPDIDKIKAVLEKIAVETKKFQLQLKGFSHFNYRVLWVGGDSGQKQATDLANKIDFELNKLGFEKEARPYAVHLTLARVKSLKDKMAFQKLLLNYGAESFGTFTVDKFLLIKSVLAKQGPIYTTLKEFTFLP